MQQPAGHAALPIEADIEKISAVLREDMTAAVLAEMANRLLQLAAAELHPRLRAALLDRAASLCGHADPARALSLWLEAFRLFPDAQVGRHLAAIAADDPSFARLNRLGHLVDAIAELAPGVQRPDDLLAAAQYHIQLGHGASAQAALAKLAELAPAHPQLLELSEVALQQSESRADALQAMRLELAQASADERAKLLIGYADMLLHGDEPLADAAAVLADAVDSGVAADEVAPMWVEVARAMGDGTELARALALALQDDTSPQRLQYADELANLPEIERTQPSAAVTALRLLGATNPDDVSLAARLAIAEAFALGIGAEPALEAVRLRALQSRDRVLESAACLALAQVAQASGDVEKAERHFRRVRSLSPHNPEALDFFEQWYRRAGDHRRLFAALTQRAAQSDGRVLVRIALEMAQLAEGPLAATDPTTAVDRAVEAYQRVLTVQPDHMDAIAALERLLTTGQRWPELAALLARSANVYAPRAIMDSSARDFAIAIWNRLASLYADPARLPDPDAALEARLRVLDLDPRNPEALQAVSATWQEAGDWTGIRDMLLTAIEAAEDPHELASLSQRLGELYRDHLNSPEEAATWLDRAAMSEPDRADARQQAQALWRARGDRDRLLDALMTDLRSRWGRHPTELTDAEVLELTPEPERDAVVAILEEAVQLATDAAGQGGPESRGFMATLWNLLLILQPGHMAALDALHGLWADGDTARLVDVLRRQLVADTLPEPRKIAVLERLCPLLLGAANDDRSAAEEALRAATQLANLAPESPVARSTQLHALLALDDLAGLRSAYAPDEAGAAEFAGAIAAIAEDKPVEGRASWLQTAAGVLTIAGEHAQATRLLADALQAAELTEDAEGRQATVVATAEALLASARAAELVGLERLAIETLAAHAPAADLPRYKQMRTALLVSAGLWSDATAAAGDWIEELIAGGHLGDLREALVELKEAARRAGELETVPHRLLMWAEIVPPDGDAAALRVEMWLDAARLLLTSGNDLETARQAVDLATEAQPAAQEVLTLRERVCTEQADWPAVVATLERLAEQQTVSERLDTLLRAANLCDHALADPATAAQLYRQVLEETPDALEAWYGLAAALRKAGTIDERADVLDSLLARDDLSRDSRARLALERVDLAHERAEPERAAAALAVLARLAALLDADPAEVLPLNDSENALLGVGLSLVDDPEFGPMVAELLLPVLRAVRSQDPTAQHGLLRCLDALAASPEATAEERQAWLAEAAACAGEDPRRRYAAVRDRVEHTPDVAQLDALSELAGAADADGDCNGLLLAMASGELAQDLRKHAAWLLAKRSQDAHDHPHAITAWTLLHQIEPEDTEPLVRLAELFSEIGDWDGLEFALREQTAMGGAENRIAAWLRLAALQLDTRRDAAAAVAVTQEALAAAGDDDRLWTQHLRALREAKDSSGLLASLQQRVAQTHLADETRLTLRREIASLHEDAHDFAAALTVWLQLACDDPHDDEATEHATAALLEATAHEIPEDLGAAARALTDVLDLRGDDDRLLAVLNLRLGHATAAEKPGLLDRLVTLRTGGDDFTGAFDAAAMLLVLRPEAGEAIERVQRLAQQAGISHERVAATFLTAVDQAELAVRRPLREAAIAVLPDDETTLAVRRQICDAALADDPQDQQWLQRSEAWAQAAGDDQGRLAILARRVAIAADNATRLPLQHERARLADRLGDADTARAAWQDVLTHEDADARREAAAALRDLCERAGDHAGAAQAICALRQDTDDAEARRALALQAAEAWQAAGDASQALAVLESEAADATALDPTLYRALATLLPDGEKKTQHLAQGWQRVLTDDAERLATATAWLAAHGDDGAGPAWQRLAQVLDAGVRGEELTERLALLAADDDAEVAIAAGTRLADQAVEAHDVAGEMAARQALLAKLDGEAARAERRRLAELLERAGENEDALAHLRVILTETWDRSVAEKALALAESTAVAHEVAVELAHVAARAVDVDDLAHVLDFTGTAELAQAAGSAMLARLETANDAAEQAALLRFLLTLAHAHGLDELREKTIDHVSAGPHLQDILAQTAGDPLVAPLRLRAAELALNEATPEGHAAALQQLAALRASVSGDVAGALDLLLHRTRAGDPVAALSEARALADEHGRPDLWLDAAENLLMDPDLTGDQRAQTAKLAADVALQQSDPARAAAMWQLVWDDEPDSAEGREQVLKFRRQAGNPALLAAAIERAMLLGGEVDRGALRVELADLKRQLGKSREALRLLQDAVASEPNRNDVIPVAERLMHDPQLMEETLELLERQYRQHAQWSQLTDVLQQRMDRAQRPTSRIALAQALATVQQQHGDVTGAVNALMTVLRAAPTLEGLAAVERLCDAHTHPEALAEAYSAMQDADLKPEQLEGVLRRAIAFDLSRGATEFAEARLLALVALRPDDDAVFAQLSELLSSIDRREDLMAAWQARLAAHPKESRQREGLREIAALARALGHVDVAIDAAQTWLELAPDDVDALEVLADLLRELERPAELAAVLVQLAQGTADPGDRARILIETARQHERLGDIDAQHASYEGAFDADPTNDEAFVFLERKAGADPEKLIPLYARRSEVLPPGPSRTLILRKLANAAAELNDGTTACQALETAIADDPRNTVVLDELLRIAEQQHEWQTWLSTAEKRLGVETRKEGKASLRRQMARVSLTDQVDPVAAAGHIAALEKLTPDDPSVAQFKTMLQARSADPREAAAGLEALLKDAADTATQTSLHQQLADLYAGPLENPGKAIRELVRLVQLDPRRWTARRRLCDLYKARNSMEAYAESLRQWLQTLGDSRDANTLSAERIRQLGALQLELGEALAAVGQVAEAASVLKDALVLNGHSVRLDGILAQMLEATSDTAGAAELEDWLVSHHALDDRELMAAHAQKAAQLWEQLGEHAKARDAHRRVLEVRSDDPVAMLGQGRACLEMGDTDRALRLFDTVSRNTKAAPKLRADALVGMGRCRMSRLALDQARNCYERALQLVPGHRGALDGLSEL